MRVTNSMLIGNFLSNMNNNLKRIEVHQNQLATGRKITRPSQDPVGVTRSLQARTELNKIDQYTRNVGDAKAWLTQTETALSEMNSILARVYELAVDGANGSKTPEDREAIAKEVTQLKHQLVESMNTTYAGRYIFGGSNTTDRPFNIDSATGKLMYNGEFIDDIKDGTYYSTNDVKIDNLLSQKIEYEVGQDAVMDININGLKLLGVRPGVDAPDLFSSVYDLEQALLNDDQEALTQSIGTVQAEQEKVLGHLAEVGGRYNRLDLIEKRLASDEINYMKIKSDVEDVDQAHAIMEYMMAQMVYRASLSVGSRIIQPSLVDFLR